MFELRHLRYFIAVAEELNFTRAAERLRTAQPSLSQQIRTLEAYLGIQLLARNKRKVELTQAGIRFLGEARLALAQAEKAIIRARQSDEIEHLKLGFTHSLIVALLPQLQPLIQARFPTVQITTRSMASGDLEQALKDDELDIIFTNIRSREYDVTSHRLFRQSLIAVFPNADPQAAVAGGIALAELTSCKIITEATTLSADMLRRLLAETPDQATRLEAIHEAANLFEALGLILSGGGVGLFESSLARLMPAGLTCRRLADADPKADVVLSHRSSFESAKLSKFLRLAQEINVVHS